MRHKHRSPGLRESRHAGVRAGLVWRGSWRRGVLKKWALSSELKFTGVKLQKEGGRRISLSEGPTRNGSKFWFKNYLFSISRTLDSVLDTEDTTLSKTHISSQERLYSNGEEKDTK